MGVLRTHGLPLATVALGGTLGAATREALILLFPSSSPLPWAVLLANLGGALLLGVLLQQLARRRGGKAGTTLRLLLGTGFCGGFTTFSFVTLTIAAVGLDSPDTWVMLLVSLIGGLIAGWTGLRAGELFWPAPEGRALWPPALDIDEETDMDPHHGSNEGAQA